MVKRNTIAIISIISITLIFSIAMWIISDMIGDWAVNGNFFLVTIVNLVTNPFYLGTLILLFISLFKVFKLDKTALNYIRVGIGSIIIALALDIISILHSIRIDYSLQNSYAISLYFDTILGKSLMPILQPMSYFGTFILYVMIPAIMIIIAIIIVHPKAFVQLFKSEVGYR